MATAATVRPASHAVRDSCGAQFGGEPPRRLLLAHGIHQRGGAQREQGGHRDHRQPHEGLRLRCCRYPSVRRSCASPPSAAPLAPPARCSSPTTTASAATALSQPSEVVRLTRLVNASAPPTGRPAPRRSSGGSKARRGRGVRRIAAAVTASAAVSRPTGDQPAHVVVHERCGLVVPAERIDAPQPAPVRIDRHHHAEYERDRHHCTGDRCATASRPDELPAARRQRSGEARPDRAASSPAASRRAVRTHRPSSCAAATTAAGDDRPDDREHRGDAAEDGRTRAARARDAGQHRFPAPVLFLAAQRSRTEQHPPDQADDHQHAVRTPRGEAAERSEVSRLSRTAPRSRRCCRG